MLKECNLTTFYREGINRRGNFVSLSEGVFKIYKTSYVKNITSDMVKLLKMRSITTRLKKDTLFAKIKSGIISCLMLDIVKAQPEYLFPLSDDEYYQYESNSLAIIDNRITQIISFKQNGNIEEPLYRGELYIDVEDKSLLHATFEIAPQYIGKATDIFVQVNRNKIKIVPQKIAYMVSYKKWDNKYYISHVRGDLRSDFWGNFNIILPEEELCKSINKISSKKKTIN